MKGPQVRTGNDTTHVRRVLAGDKSAFGPILDAHQSSVYRLALRYTGSASEAEDLTQEIFIAVYSSLPRFEGRSALSTWIFRIALNHCLERRRRKRPEVTPFDDLAVMQASKEDGPEAALEKSERRSQVQNAIDSLSPLHRDVVALHELQGLTYQEVAEALNVPVGTVKSRLSNALRRLRDTLSQSIGGELTQ